MLVTVFSKDSKRGFAAGSNKLTPEKLAAGAITAAAGLVIAAIGGLLRLNRSGKPKKKKPPIWLAVLPAIYGAAKSKAERKALNGLVAEAEKAGKELGISGETVLAEDAAEGDHGGIEVVGAIPISSEEEVYEHI